MKYSSKCPYNKKHVLPTKVPDCAPVTLTLTFHSNFHPNHWFLESLPFKEN